MLISGQAFLLLGIWGTWRAFAARARRKALLRNPVKVKGKVVRVEDASSEGDSLSWWQPVVVYAGKDGRTHELKLDPKLDVKKFRVGTTVRIFHERGSPENAFEELRMWDLNVICALALLPFLLGAACVITAYQNLRPSK